MKLEGYIHYAVDSSIIFMQGLHTVFPLFI
jgi:hypothetical protein